LKVNLGSGQAYLDGWVNVDPSRDVHADIHLDAAEFVRQYGPQIEQVYLGHVLEHLMPGDALVLLRLLNERLPRGAVVSAVSPDMAAIWDAYRSGEIDNYQLNASFIYSYVQPSHHVWCYDQTALLALFANAGFTDPEPIDPHSWEPVFHKEGIESRWQTGVKASALGTRIADLGGPPDLQKLTWDEIEAEVARRSDRSTGPITANELLVRKVELLRQSLGRERTERLSRDDDYQDAVRQLDEARAELEHVTGKHAELTKTLKATGISLEPDPALIHDVTAAGTGAPAGTGPKMLPGNSPVTPPTPPPSPDTLPEGGARGKLRRFAAEKLPEGSSQRELAKVALETYRESREFGRRVKNTWRNRAVASGKSKPRSISYRKWLAGHAVGADAARMQRVWAEATPDKVSIQVIVLPGPGRVQATLDSLLGQSWPYWQAAICTSASEPPPVRDSRVSNAAVDTGSVFDAANATVTNSASDQVVVLRSGDVLRPDCLFTIASAVHQDPLLEVVIWDDDVVGPDGSRTAPRFRPSFSPEMLLGADYIGGACAIRRRAFLAAGGLLERFGRHALWNLLLTLDLDAERASRVSRVLSSTTDRPAPDPALAPLVVQHQLDRRGLDATAELVGQVVRVRWGLAAAPHVSVIIPTRHNRSMLSTCLPSLARTDYPSFDVVIVDNGGQSDANDEWYQQFTPELDLQVKWWTQTPFNYSAVNNAGAELARGEVLVFLNDDTELLDPSWMRELVGWAGQPDIGVAGLQLIGPDDEIQHTGVILGLGGFADHIFEGTKPHEDSIFGRNDWYRNCLAVTGACMAMRRELYDRIGGLDERFILCGSDVALGLDTVLRGYRNVCSPFGTIRHLESATRGSDVPRWDFFMSYWRYNSWLFGGDPYFSPNVSLSSRVPALRTAEEPTPQQRVAIPLGRTFTAFKQSTTESESLMLANICRALPIDVAAVNALHAENAEPFDVRTINWFIPDIDSPFYGGINTAFRIADELARRHGVENRFMVWGQPNEFFVRSALAAAFPALQDSVIEFYADPTPALLQSLPQADVSIATLWVTAYAVTHFPNTKRKFYLIQDFEPMFYPASTLYALAEETYSLGLYGLCNTENLHKIYDTEYHGKGMSFMPAVDPSVFHANGRVERADGAPVTLFVYGRPGHWRNCWEMTSLALEELKRRLGDGVRIITAGAWATGGGAEMDVKRLGLLDYRATGELYRQCDVGLALTVSKHPSYLPLEMMACGVPVVAFDNPWGYWILDEGVNSLMAKRTVDSLVDRLETMCVQTETRKQMAAAALQTIATGHSDWEKALAPIYPYLCDPEGRRDQS
jgi:GT2 family glycosyltransferase/glycosyltransferase involved in cell wall biosynthesis/predicted SAM-dependent methyltransferase